MTLRLLLIIPCYLLYKLSSNYKGAFPKFIHKVGQKSGSYVKEHLQYNSFNKSSINEELFSLLLTSLFIVSEIIYPIILTLFTDKYLKLYLWEFWEKKGNMFIQTYISYRHNRNFKVGFESMSKFKANNYFCLLSWIQHYCRDSKRIYRGLRNNVYVKK